MTNILSEPKHAPHSTNRQMEGLAAIVVGAGRGIGEAVALRFSQEGARVVLAARTASELDTVCQQIQQAGGDACAVAIDATERERVDHLVDAALSAYGRIDVLVNAAGMYGPIGNLWEIDPGECVRTFSVNVFSAFLLCRAVLPHMIAARRGKIINFSGGGAAAPLAGFSAYGASKAALVRLTETISEEVRDFNIQINAIAPGAVDTKLQDEVLAAGQRAGEIYQRMKRMRETGEGATPRSLPAELAVFLASGNSRGLTGKLISAPHDGWQLWDARRIEEISSTPWFTLRRLDMFTVEPLTRPIRARATASNRDGRG